MMKEFDKVTHLKNITKEKVQACPCSIFPGKTVPVKDLNTNWMCRVNKDKFELIKEY